MDPCWCTSTGWARAPPASVPDHLAPWPGPIVALDLTGHGRSGCPDSGGYTCEVLMGDVDLALAQTGPATVFGRGLGAYVALLIAGGRPALVRGAILTDGPGLAGGGPAPLAPYIVTVVPAPPPGGTPDPWALAELARDVRPPDYAATFARSAATRSELEIAVAVCGHNRPDWLVAVLNEPGVIECGLAEAIELFGSAGA